MVLKERVLKDGHMTGASLYGVLVHDASLGGLKGLNPSGFVGDILVCRYISGNRPTSGAHPLLLAYFLCQR